MESSPIRINEATAEELCRLSLIGPKHAARIIRYRKEIAPIRSARDLAVAAGISITQARTFAAQIDWATDDRAPLMGLVTPIVALGACAIVLMLGVDLSGLDTSRPAASLFNAAIILNLVGCIVAIAHILFDQHLRAEPAKLLAITCWIAGVTLLMSLAVTVMVTGATDEFSTHVLASWKFVIFVIIVAVILQGPSLLLRANVAPDMASVLFDNGQLALLPFVFAALVFGNQPSLLEELFGIWAGIMFSHNGFEMMFNRSSFVSTLSKDDQQLLQFLVRESGFQLPKPSKGTGTLLAGGGLVLIAVSATRIWG